MAELATFEFDVVVVGGGPAGLCAATAAAQGGARTVLIERTGAIGGALTQGLALSPVGFEPFKYWMDDTNPDGWKVQGLARRLHDRMLAEGAVRKPTWEPETYKVLADRMLEEAGCRVLFHAQAIAAEVAGGRVEAVVVAGAASQRRLRGKVIVDCTGDGELMALAGAAHELGRPADGRVQPMVLGSIFGGVRLPYTPDMTYKEMLAVSQTHVVPLVREGIEAGKLPPVYPGILFPWVSHGRVVPDVVWCRFVNIWKSPASLDEVSEAERDARRLLAQVHAFLRAHVPGMEDCYLARVSGRVYPREGRRLVGADRLVENDVRTDRLRDDGIAKGCGHLEIHAATPGVVDPEDGYTGPVDSRVFDDICYDIPYGALVPRDLDGLLVGGRCISADRGAQSSVRMQATSMALGEAAGTAAALCAARGCQPRELPAALLRERLRARGAMV